MEIKDLEKKKIGILGLGIENASLVDFLLKKKIDCEITICDARSRGALRLRSGRALSRVNWKTGNSYNQGLYKFDILFRAPGWPIFCPGVQEALQNGVELYSPMRLFFDFCPTKNVIGVTGSKGKGTTSSLICHILKAAKKKVWLGGNIGVAPFEFLPKINKDDWVVLELSSFQLEDFTVSPHIAVITNFTREHLAPADPNNRNFHKSLKDYWKAKANIFKWQGERDYFIVNKKISNMTEARHGASLVAAQNFAPQQKIIKFGKSNLKSSLVGEHNKENIAAAVEVAKILKIKQSVIKKAVASFQGLEHRLEFVIKQKGVEYYNDTFATTPEAAITAIRSFKHPIILLAGGSEKKSDFKELVMEIKKRVKFVVLIVGEATPRLRKELLKIKYPENKISLAGSMNEAVRLAKSQSSYGDVILLSPACASFGIFKNYKQRGDLFKESVIKIRKVI